MDQTRFDIYIMLWCRYLVAIDADDSVGAASLAFAAQPICLFHNLYDLLDHFNSSTKVRFIFTAFSRSISGCAHRRSMVCVPPQVEENATYNPPLYPNHRCGPAIDSIILDELLEMDTS